MSLKIYTERCKGCGICAAFCPKKVLAVSELEKIEAVAPENCIQCGQCELRCPDFAILYIKKEMRSNVQGFIIARQPGCC